MNPQFFIRRPRFALVISILITIFGIMAGIVIFKNCCLMRYADDTQFLHTAELPTILSHPNTEQSWKIRPH